MGQPSLLRDCLRRRQEQILHGRAFAKIVQIVNPGRRLGRQLCGRFGVIVQPGQPVRIRRITLRLNQARRFVWVERFQPVEEHLRVGRPLVIQPQTRHDPVRGDVVGQLLKDLNCRLRCLNRVPALPQNFGQQNVQVGALRVLLNRGPQLDQRLLVEVAVGKLASQPAPGQLNLVGNAVLAIAACIQIVQGPLQQGVARQLLVGPFQVPDGPVEIAVLLADLAQPQVRDGVVRQHAQDPQEDLCGFLQVLLHALLVTFLEERLTQQPIRFHVLRKMLQDIATMAHDLCRRLVLQQPVQFVQVFPQRHRIGHVLLISRERLG